MRTTRVAATNHWTARIAALAMVAVVYIALRANQDSPSVGEDGVLFYTAVSLPVVLLLARAIDAASWQVAALWTVRALTLPAIALWLFMFVVLAGELQGGTTGAFPFLLTVAVCLTGAWFSLRGNVYGGAAILLAGALTPVAGMFTLDGPRSVLAFALVDVLLGAALAMTSRLARAAPEEPTFGEWLAGFFGRTVA